MTEEIKEAILYLEHTSKDDFNLEEHQKENRIWAIKILLNYITNLQKENEYLKLNNPEMNIEHFKIIKENKRKIDILRKQNKDYKSRNEKAVEYIKIQQKIFGDYDVVSENQLNNLLNILQGGDE